MKYVIVRSISAGVFAGYLSDVDYNSRVVTLKKAKRIWYWEGAASLSELAVYGTCKPDKCKIPVQVPSIKVFEICEIIPMTKKARLSFEKVPLWTSN